MCSSDLDIGTIVHICTTGIPYFSIPFTIVAPQRVQVPQVDVRITASTPSATNFFPISSANAFALATAVPFPTVVENFPYNFPIFPAFSNSLSTSTGNTRSASSFAYTGSYPP